MLNNPLNMNEIDDFLTGLADGNEQLGKFMVVALRKPILKEDSLFTPVREYPDDAPAWLTKEKFKTGSFHVFETFRARQQIDRFNHIRDWIGAAIINNDAWTKNLDAQGRPKKLLNIGTIAEATDRANKTMKIRANNLRSKFANAAENFETDEKDGHIKTIREFDDGSRLVKLLTPHALDMESAHLGHCIGEGYYDESLKDPKTAFYSLRDPLNRAHVTFHVHDGWVAECKGKENAPPVAKYLDQVQEVIIEHKWKVRGAQAACTGLLLYQDGIYHDIRNLPDGFKCNGNIDLKDAEWLTRLPDNMEIFGDLLLKNCTGLTALPEKLKIVGHLDLNECTNLTHIPKNLSAYSYSINDKTFNDNMDDFFPANYLFWEEFRKLNPPQPLTAETMRFAGITPA